MARRPFEPVAKETWRRWPCSTSQRFHMKENVLGAVTARKETIALRPIEPFDRRAFEIAGRRLVQHRRRGRQRRRRRIVDIDNPQRLQPFGPSDDFADDRRTLARGRSPRIAQARRMDQNVSHAVGRHDKTVTLCRIKPFHDPFDRECFAVLPVRRPGAFCAPRSLRHNSSNPRSI